MHSSISVLVAEDDAGRVDGVAPDFEGGVEVGGLDLAGLLEHGVERGEPEDVGWARYPPHPAVGDLRLAVAEGLHHHPLAFWAALD